MSDLSLPSLVTVAHGTRRAGGNEIARQITRGAGVALGVDGNEDRLHPGGKRPQIFEQLVHALQFCRTDIGTKRVAEKNQQMRCCEIGSRNRPAGMINQ